MKEKYERAELDIIEFETYDVILTSDPSDEEPEDEYMLPVR